MPATTIRTHHHSEFTAAQLADAKGERTVSVCLPARNEALTIGPIVEAIRTGLCVRYPLVDEILVIDDHSDDDTAPIALEAGAKVVKAQEVLPDYGEGHGKGEALWKSLFVSTGDIVVWCDTDIREFDLRFPVGLLGPLLALPGVSFVKGFYERPSDGSIGGGRVTELVARPMLSLLFPHLMPIAQPLAGECGGKRSVLERLPFVHGYGVDLGLLIDVAESVGVARIAQVDLGTRIHRNRTLAELAPQARAVLETALRRADRDHAGAGGTHRFASEPGSARSHERPPLTSVPLYRRATA